MGAIRFPNIEAERARNNFSQNDLAVKLGVTPGTYRNWQKGKNVIPASKIVLMADLFKVSTDYLLAVEK